MTIARCTTRERGYTWRVQTLRIYRWRRLDDAGLEVLRLANAPAEITAQSIVVDAGAQPFGLRYRWTLDSDWRTRSIHVQVDTGLVRELLIERLSASTWRIGGVDRPDLDGCEEVDLSATPFCNSLALRRFAPPPGGAGALTALYVEFPQLEVSPSRQRYEQLGPNAFRYVDLGAKAGFTARLDLDADGFVERYEGLFERFGAGA
jgi:hypothetical protein